MMSYTDYLASRGYVRVVVERTVKEPNDLVLIGRDVVREPARPEPKNVVAIRRRGKSA